MSYLLSFTFITWGYKHVHKHCPLDSDDAASYAHMIELNGHRFERQKRLRMKNPRYVGRSFWIQGRRFSSRKGFYFDNEGKCCSFESSCRVSELGIICHYILLGFWRSLVCSCKSQSPVPCICYNWIFDNYCLLLAGRLYAFMLNVTYCITGSEENSLNLFVFSL